MTGACSDGIRPFTCVYLTRMKKDDIYLACVEELHVEAPPDLPRINVHETASAKIDSISCMIFEVLIIFLQLLF